MNTLAIRIFLSFWLLHFLLLLLIIFVLPPLNEGRRFSEAVQQFGAIAVAVEEKEGASACSQFLSGLRTRTAMNTALYDDHETAVCRSGQDAELALFQPYLSSSKPVL